MKTYRTYDLCNNVKFFREMNGISQSDLADTIGTTQNTISAIESGKYCPSAYLAFLLCTAFHVDFESLFFFDYEGEHSYLIPDWKIVELPFGYASESVCHERMVNLP